MIRPHFKKHRRTLSSAVSVRASPVVAARTHVKPIETVQVGDLVWAWDEATKALVKRRVTRLFRHRDKPTVRVRFGGDDNAQESIDATTEHPFYVLGRGWVSASQLQPGDVLQRVENQGVAKVISVTQSGATADVFNFEVAQTHNYFVGRAGVLVHNSSDPRPETDFSEVRRSLGEDGWEKIESLPAIDKIARVPQKTGKFAAAPLPAAPASRVIFYGPEQLKLGQAVRLPGANMGFASLDLHFDNGKTVVSPIDIHLDMSRESASFMLMNSREVNGKRIEFHPHEFNLYEAAIIAADLAHQGFTGKPLKYVELQIEEHELREFQQKYLITNQLTDPFQSDVGKILMTAMNTRFGQALANTGFDQVMGRVPTHMNIAVDVRGQTHHAVPRTVALLGARVPPDQVPDVRPFWTPTGAYLNHERAWIEQP